MSEIIQGADESIDETADAAEEVGLTSEESSEESSEKKKLIFAELTIFDAMLLISLICTLLATLILFFALREYGPFPFSFPWRTSDI